MTVQRGDAGTETAGRRCVFFDRDGVVNESPGEGVYVERWSDFRILPGFVEALRVVREAGCEAVIVTNQRGVALGILSLEAVTSMHANLAAVLRDRHGLELTDILCCPHDKNECDCRKPKPGMLLEAARRHPLDLKRSWMIGDRVGDVAAGKAAGCRTIFVGQGPEDGGADYRIGDMDELAGLLARIL